MLPLVLLMSNNATAEPTPAVSSVQVSTLEPGSCSTSTWASLQVAWAIVNEDADLYDTKVYENGVLQDTLANDVQTYEKEITNQIEDSDFLPTESDWIYRIDVVRKSDGQVVSSAQSAMWQQVYGFCF